ncbi:penicillin acylase family protein [Kitasatospora sp. NPDC051984]|uniref:penicillin acylase family protein n=1 Tax=Kitasatospora sp. NPDC051984 TaxID=3364059 RepID=UPI0037CC3046
MTENTKLTDRQSRAKMRRLASGALALGLAAGLLTALTPTSAQAAADTELTAGQGTGWTAKIRRTEYGVPHVLAQDFGGLGYGYGYAFAQDNLCELADQVVTLRGERSRWFGADGRSSDRTGNLDSDTYQRGLLQAGTVRRLMAEPAPLGPTGEARQLVDGYVAGYNRYLHDTGVDHLPDPSCQGKGWVGPITAEDIWSVLYNVNTMSGVAKTQFAEAVPGAGATAAQAATTTAPAAPAGATAAQAPTVAPWSHSADDTPDTGSNAWAIGRDADRDGHGLLLANPHLQWTGPERFYQAQLTIPGVVDVAGAGLYGLPFIQIGHTKGLAWTHTTSYADHATLYRLSLVPGDPTAYLVDGKAERMTTETVKVTVRASDGTLSTVDRSLYRSRQGYVLADGWTGEQAYTLRDSNAGNLRSLNEWLAVSRSQNLDQLRQAQRTYQGNPWAYTTAVDSTGTAYFTDSSAVPHLPDAQLTRCLVPGPWSTGVLDGSTTACDPGSDPDALVPGIFGPANHPALTRTDYVANSNNGPYLTNADAPMAGLPTVYNAAQRIATRPQLGLRMIADRRAGTDGLGAPGFTLDTLRATMFGNRVQSAELDRDDAVALCRAHPALTASDGTPVDVRAACDVLAAWDTRADADSRGTVLWQAYRDALAGTRTMAWQTVPYDPARPLTTPRGIAADNADAQRAFADAVRRLAAAGLPVDAPIGAVQRWAGIPLHGCAGQLGCFNVLTAQPSSGEGGGTYPAAGAGVPHGSSFLMATELTQQGPRTRTLLAYGQSADPTSPHFTDQTRRYAAKQWVTERFTEAEIRSAPGLTVTTLHR